MRQSKKEFYHKGHEHQKTPSIVFDLKRIDEKKLQDMSEETKSNLKEFISDCKQSFNVFMRELSIIAK